MMKPMDVMTAGRIAFGMDPTGAPFGIWQAGDDKGVGAMIQGPQGEIFSIAQTPQRDDGAGENPQP